jgi:hypothetical protein
MDNPDFDFRAGILFASRDQTGCGTHPSVSSGQWRCFPAAKQLERAFPHLALCPTAGENAWSFTSPPLHVFLTRTRDVLPFTFVWSLVVHVYSLWTAL